MVTVIGRLRDWFAHFAARGRTSTAAPDNSPRFFDREVS
jgi:hypothetical protein